MRTVIALCAVLALAGVASADMIADGGFESGDMSAWVGPVQNAAPDATAAKDGAYGALTPFSGEIQFSQLIDLVDGTEYTASFDLYCVDYTPGGWGVFGLRGGQWPDLGDNSVFSPVNGLGFENGGVVGEWIHYSQTWTQSGDVSPYIGLRSFGMSGEFYVDNVSLVPEPATMSLLGLGALALIRRRK